MNIDRVLKQISKQALVLNLAILTRDIKGEIDRFTRKSFVTHVGFAHKFLIVQRLVDEKTSPLPHDGGIRMSQTLHITAPDVRFLEREVSGDVLPV